MKICNPAAPSLLAALSFFLLAGPGSAATAAADTATAGAAEAAEAAGRDAAGVAGAAETSDAARTAHSLLGSLASDENECSAQAGTCLSDDM